MLPDRTLDLGTPVFWFAVLAAVIVIVPIAHGRARAIAIAIVDLAVACFVAGAGGAPYVLGLVAALYALVALTGRTRIAALAAAVVLVALFVAYKRPDVIAPKADARGALTAIGFSYVALRAVELVRAVAERRHPPPSPCALIAYLVPFHMLAAGPIQSYDEFVAQPAVPEPLATATALDGLDRIARGLFNKFVVAQALRALLLTDFAARGWYLVVEIQAYYVWVYLDFSAYSDIAAGVGRLLGRATPENFARPFAARNITEFWERWHISLSLFVRRNVFIPLQLALGRRTGGSRPLATACIAIAVAFLACGLWHGISLRFLAWGAFHAIGLVATQVYRHALVARLGRKGVKSYLARPVIRAIATLLTFEFVAISLAFVVFPFEEL